MWLKMEKNSGFLVKLDEAFKKYSKPFWGLKQAWVVVGSLCWAHKLSGGNGSPEGKEYPQAFAVHLTIVVQEQKPPWIPVVPVYDKAMLSASLLWMLLSQMNVRGKEKLSKGLWHWQIPLVTLCMGFTYWVELYRKNPVFWIRYEQAGQSSPLNDLKMIQSFLLKMGQNWIIYWAILSPDICLSQFSHSSPAFHLPSFLDLERASFFCSLHWITTSNASKSTAPQSTFTWATPALSSLSSPNLSSTLPLVLQSPLV